MDFHPLEDPVYRIGILAGELFRLSLRLEFQHHQTAGLVCEGAGKNDAALLCQRLKIREVGRAINLSFRFTLRTIVSKNDKFHRQVSFAGTLYSMPEE